jgi:REP element-mobilizing transposase RayT
MYRLTTEEIDQIIDFLQGSCNSLDVAIELCIEEDGVHGLSDIQNDMELFNRIDHSIFECSQCGWWCENGDWITEEHPNYDPNAETCTQCGDD